MSRENELLDAIEDAEEALKEYTDRVHWFSIGLGGSLLFILAGSLVGTFIPGAGGLAAGMIMPAVVIGFACGTMLACVVEGNEDSESLDHRGRAVTHKGPKTKLREAKRAHRDFMLTKQ